MDDSVDNPDLSWSGPIAAAWVAGIGSCALVAAVLGTPDLGGRVFLALAAVALAFVAVNLAVRRPRLAIVGSSLAVRGLTKRTIYSREQLINVQVLELRRIGRRTPLLEVDVRDEAGVERLLIFSWWDLGASPLDVYQALDDAGLAVRQARR